MKSATLAIAFAMLAAAIPAAAQNSRSSPNRIVQPGANAQNRIAKEVRHELVMLPWYGVFDNLEYNVNEGTVTLSGSVVRPALKSDAEAAVKQIEGVHKVINDIKVLPLSPMDDRIRMAEFHAIYGDTNLSRYAIRAVPPIHIVVDNGHVTLVGIVGSQGDKDIAGIRAKEVPGTFSVTNDLRVSAD
jgi:hyperosmotically inducible protein